MPGGMRVVLAPVPEHPDAIGLVDGMPLKFEGRTPFVGGRPVEHADIAEHLADAVEAAASALWGSDYTNALARVSDLNRRTVTRDRFARNGLPMWLLGLLGRAAAAPAPRAMGYLLLAATELVDRGPYSQGGAVTRTHPRDRDALGVLAREGFDEALALVHGARDARERPMPKNDAT
ncbi:hypothetical protein GCM10007886_33410 [Methylobacterium gregans]|jgi:hypothetical protein|uniref:Uncharacterized protein n=2 Tax=Hyphomicrobiales TaxID=356 RepID=A0AA37HQ32_9HYPH|nr:hypothetical protein NBEOAGPD_2813 [Methylobacterium gregans]GLS55157.1 hypothetical protein GCM10007886_33410 [Methylobacterium gregans]